MRVRFCLLRSRSAAFMHSHLKELQGRRSSDDQHPSDLRGLANPRPCRLDFSPDGGTRCIAAHKLSNNTAEGQGLVEALMWLVHASRVPRGALVLIRPDSKVVVGWATGLTAARSNHELASNLKRIYLQASSLWRVRWSHVKGHIATINGMMRQTR